MNMSWATFVVVGPVSCCGIVTLQVYVVTDYDFANKVEVAFDELFSDMEGQLHVAAMSKDGSKIVIGGHQGFGESVSYIAG